MSAIAVAILCITYLQLCKTSEKHYGHSLYCLYYLVSPLLACKTVWIHLGILGIGEGIVVGVIELLPLLKDGFLELQYYTCLIVHSLCMPRHFNLVSANILISVPVGWCTVVQEHATWLMEIEKPVHIVLLLKKKKTDHHRGRLWQCNSFCAGCHTVKVAFVEENISLLQFILLLSFGATFRVGRFKLWWRWSRIVLSAICCIRSRYSFLISLDVMSGFLFTVYWMIALFVADNFLALLGRDLDVGTVKSWDLSKVHGPKTRPYSVRIILMGRDSFGKLLITLLVSPLIE